MNSKIKFEKFINIQNNIKITNSTKLTEQY